MPLPEEEISRYEKTMKITTADAGTLSIRMVDRINVDDVFLHLVARELWRLSVGEDPGVDVNNLFKEFLLKEQFTAGQGQS